MYNFGIVLTDEEKKRLSTFEARLRHLIFLHDELRRENAELKQLLKTKQEECEQVHAEYEALEDDYTNLKTAMTISLNGSDVKETKLRLSKLVREVDKHYQNVTPEKIIAMVAYQFALENLKMKNRNDTRPYADKIEELTEVLETYFKGL